MAGAVSTSPAEEPETVRLLWKPRRGRPGQPNESKEYGSFYTILPKEQVERLKWQKGDPLALQVDQRSLVLSRAPEGRIVANHMGSGDRFELNRLICGDVLEEMQKIPDNSVHMAITSPPYNVGAGYQGYTDDREYEDYRAWLLKVWIETRRVLVPGGRFALNIAPTSIKDYRPVHMDLSQDVEEAGLYPRTEILWYKQNMTAKRTAWGSFRSPRHPHVIPSWEYVLVFHKDGWKLEGDPSKADITSQQFVEWSDGMWKIQPETSRLADHPAAFPEELIRRLILYFTYRENTVLDMFGGTGTVAAVAKQLGRCFIHIDKSKPYCDAAALRLEGKLERGHRTKPSQRSEVRRKARHETHAAPPLEGYTNIPIVK